MIIGSFYAKGYPQKTNVLRMSPRGRTLKSQIVWSFLFTVIVILNIAAWFFHSRARDYFDAQLGKTLVGLAKSGADLIDADLLEYLKPGYEQGEFYKDLQRNLEILKKDFQVHRLFIVDESHKTLLDTDGDSPIGTTPTHLQINAVEVNAALRGDAIASTLYRGNDGNLYKSAYSPLFNKQGGVAAVVCADASPAFLQVIDQIKNLILALNLISIVAAIIISLILARSILSPVRLLVDAARRVSRGDFSEPVAVSHENEIGFLAQVFNSMQENIKAKEEHLEKLKKVAEGRAEAVQSYNDYILRSISHGILTCDLNGIITIINPAAERILQLSRNHSRGKKYTKVLGEKHPFAAFVRQTLRSAPRPSEQKIEIAFPDATKVLSADVSPLLDSEQKTIGVNFVITDLTEIRRLQETIREKERLAYLGELSATVAHEVRNPLNSIELFVGLLNGRMHKKKERTEAIDKIRWEIRALNDFITDFLEFARPQELKLQNVSVSKLLQEVIFLTWKELQDKQIDVKMNLPKKNLYLRGDFEQLKRALLNIILNAVQSMQKNGTLTVVGSALECPNQKDQIEIQISDTGYGISKEDLDKIFQPFYSTRSQGTGLGLAIVKNIINAHHGTIIVKNKLPNGTNFVVQI